MNNITTTEAPATTGKTIHATVHIKLSDAGQRAAVLADRPAAQFQALVGHIAASDLDLCIIDAQGNVICRTYRESGGATAQHYTTSGSIYGDAFQVTTHGVGMEFDAPPKDAADAVTAFRASIEASKAEAAAGAVKGNTERQARIDAELAKEATAIDTFIADPNARGTAWDSDRTSHLGGVQLRRDPRIPEVRTEILRRNALDAKAKADAERAEAAAKEAAIVAFLAAHGTPDQLERYEADLLPEAELRTILTDHAFAALENFLPYQRITEDEVRSAFDEQFPDFADPDLSVQFRTGTPAELTARQWQALKAMRAAVPGVTIEPRLHEATVDHSDVPWGVVERYSAQATATVAGIKVKRSYRL